jgi:DNA-binding transcriptional LysR family regulator
MVSLVLDLTRLRSFVSAAQLGSFAAAADLLDYTAPAVSQHVAALERDLDCELLIRGPRGVKTTDAGAVLLERAEQLLNQARLTELAVRQASGQIRALRVGSFPTGAQHLLPPASQQSAVSTQRPTSRFSTSSHQTDSPNYSQANWTSSLRTGIPVLLRFARPGCGCIKSWTTR